MQHPIPDSSATESLPISPDIIPLIDAEQMFPQERIVNKRLAFICLLALFNALIIGVAAKGLVMLIDLITNISFYSRVSFDPSSPKDHHLSYWVIIVPVIGGLIVGFMAKYGSKAIRGHGIPEAMEQVLTNESKIPPAITFLKPVSAAISIGTGGPFGAEGPIIATGGAFGSFIGQVLRITPDERKILLTAGATAGMAAIFGSPVAAVLLAIELLLFEFSPRSIIPVAIACATGATMHFALFGHHVIFPMPDLIPVTGESMLIYSLIGLITGVAASAVTRLVYFVEDCFEELPINWMWWPALGGLAVGIIGYFYPLTLGVGYENITNVLSGSMALQALLLLFVFKFLSWAISLGSGTSGGTLAPLLTIGSSFGAIVALLISYFFPGLGIDVKVAALVGMAAMFAGASRAFLTSIVFALETTLKSETLLPLLAGCTASYFISFLFLRNSIMTEKIARRGIKVPDEYTPNIIDKISVRDVMNTRPIVLTGEESLSAIRSVLEKREVELEDSHFIVKNQNGYFLGVVSHKNILNDKLDGNEPLYSIIKRKPIAVYDDNFLRIAVDILAKENHDIIPVVRRSNKEDVIGTISHKNVLMAFRKHQVQANRAKTAISLKKKMGF